MRKAYLLCGVLGSGKSTWARKNANDLNAHIVSKDDIREMMYGEYKFEPTQEFLVDNIAWAAIDCIISCGANVIIDDCYNALDEFYREITISRLREIQPNIWITVVNFPATKDALDRRLENPRGYSKERWQLIYDNMMKSFKPASKNEEGIDEVRDA